MDLAVEEIHKWFILDYILPRKKSLITYIFCNPVLFNRNEFSDYVMFISYRQIETVSGTLVLRWVNSQLARILAWVERAIQQEVKKTTVGT